MNIETFLLVLVAGWWFAFWAIAKLCMYENSVEFQAVFTTRRSVLVKLVLFLLWPFLAPVLMVVLTLFSLVNS